MKRNPPTLANVIELRQRAPGSLESAAASINRHIDLYLRAGASHDAHRIRAGFELIAVRPRVEAEGFGWESWCADNINRSMRDIRRLMRLAGSDDPEAALEEERAAAREGMAANRTNVSPVQRLFRLFLKLDASQRAEFMSLVEKEMEK